MTATDRISIVIPCRNEEKFIGKCLDSILASDYPLDLVEVLVVDGCSRDRTRDIIKQYASLHPFIRLLENARRSAPAALNEGIRHARGDFIIRMDAHTFYSKNYLSASLATLKKHGADNVGGIIKTLPGEDSLIARSIAFSVAHPFGVGESHFRLGRAGTTPREVDTVPFGCFRRSLFEKIGTFNEDLPRVEDMDLNRRIRDAGGKIILTNEIVSFYYARRSLHDFWDHNFDNGFLVTASLPVGKTHYSWRHLIPLASLMTFITLAVGSVFHSLFCVSLASLVGLYLVLSLYFSLKTALRCRNPVYLFVMPLIFGILHLSYALGSLKGLLKFLPSRNRKQT